MAARKDEVECYGLTINTDEAYVAIRDGRMDKFIDSVRKYILGVYQDPNGQYQMFIFDSQDMRNKAHTMANDCGLETAAAMITPFYVEKKYLNGGEK